jgi:hypothetical protein
MQKKLRTQRRPLLFLDVDGVISLFGFPVSEPPNGTFHSIDGLPHLLSATAPRDLQILGGRFDLVWCTGWEERANEHLPRLLGLPGPLPVVGLAPRPDRRHAHWKLDAIERHAGRRPLAWIDDAHDDECRGWAAAREAAIAPTLLASTEPAVGITPRDVEILLAWAGARA